MKTRDQYKVLTEKYKQIHENVASVEQIQHELESKGFDQQQIALNVDAWLSLTPDGIQFANTMMRQRGSISSVDSIKNRLAQSIRSLGSNPNLFTRNYGIRDAVVKSGLLTNVQNVQKA